MKTFLITGILAAASSVAYAADLTGEIQIDGSSTVGPVTIAVAEAYKDEQPEVNVVVAISGSSAGFRRFLAGDTDISNASRSIKGKEHFQAVEAGIGYVEVPIAYDGLTIVVSRDNDFVDQLSIEQLQSIFIDGSTIDTWDDVNPEWPEIEIDLYIPGTQSGTYDYFREVVIGDASFRADLSSSEDDNVLVRGVSGSDSGLGFFGVAYYLENQDTLRAVSIVNEEGEAVQPDPENIEDGSYNPFSRPLFVYVSETSLARPEVASFMEFYIDEVVDIAEEVGYVALPDEIYDVARANVRKRSTGSQFLDDAGNKIEGSLAELYREL